MTPAQRDAALEELLRLTRANAEALSTVLVRQDRLEERVKAVETHMQLMTASPPMVTQ